MLARKRRNAVTQLPTLRKRRMIGELIADSQTRFRVESCGPSPVAEARPPWTANPAPDSLAVLPRSASRTPAGLPLALSPERRPDWSVEVVSSIAMTLGTRAACIAVAANASTSSAAAAVRGRRAHRVHGRRDSCLIIARFNTLTDPQNPDSTCGELAG